MVIRKAYSSVRNTWPKWRGWLTAFFVAMFLLPIVLSTAHPVQALLILTLTCLIPAGILIGLCLGTKQLLMALFRIKEPFNFFSVAATLAAVVLACTGLFVIPAYLQPFASFGANLPAPTQFLLEYHSLLLLPALFMPLMFFWLRNQPRRELYFAYFLAGEFFVLLTCALLYVQVFKIGEPVAG